MSVSAGVFLNENNPFLELSELFIRSKTLPPFVTVGADIYDKICALFTEIQNEYADTRDWREALIKAKIYEILIYFDRARRESQTLAASGEGDGQNVWRAIEHIHIAFNTDLTLEGIASKFKISAPLLNQLFKEHTGLSFAELLQDARIRNACALLQYPHISVAQIAASVGYKSFDLFHRSFKRVKGISPAHYRKCNLNYRAIKKESKGAGYSVLNARFVYYLHLHYSEALTLGDMARYFHYNENYMSEMLSQNGLDFTRLLHEIRVYHACSLLLTTDTAVNEIGFAVGFNSLETFYRVFKRLSGISPGEYRKQSVKP
ncbi:MAG: helix-turn-helix domain-containing protein [Clostridiales bacterium]|jgi:YesN/AraC family two-component response regulator|nr:helix-turn-helix domain-containing protein [Clostridiales bacterium]